MNNKTILLTTTVLLALFTGQSAIAGQAPRDEYSVANIYTTESSEATQERVNFSVKANTNDEKLGLELFPDYES